jgi:hypothetical protein
MLHVITVHRDDAPNAFRLLRDEIVAAAVFADERTPRALEVLHLTAADLRSSEAEVDPLREQRATSYTMSTLEVPAQVFDPPGADEDLAQLRTLVLQLPGFGGGAPLWLRGETSGPAAFAELATFQLQVDERLVPNLSLAGGILYVMVDGARVEA